MAHLILFLADQADLVILMAVTSALPTAKSVESKATNYSRVEGRLVYP